MLVSASCLNLYESFENFATNTRLWIDMVRNSGKEYNDFGRF